LPDKLKAITRKLAVAAFFTKHYGMLKRARKIRKTNWAILSIFLSVSLSNVMFNTPIRPVKNNYRQLPDSLRYAGSAACAGCHKDIYESHIRTAHYLDSRPATKEAIKGSFSNGNNRFAYNQWMEVKLEEKGDKFFQTAFINGTEYQSKPFDIVIGSGRKGQSYLYWDDNKLFQLPVSYYTPLNSWCNSPGFPSRMIKFNRMIPAECLECHGTYAHVEEDANNNVSYDKNQIIYGIDCERCHGPAAKHVAFHRQHPDSKTASDIIIIKQLTRQQKLDACALCHSGFRQAKQPRFSFQTGDKLDDYSLARYSPDSLSNLDVHGNQYGLLAASKCFQLSNMDCSSCHNPHKNEANSPTVFSQRCLNCHADTKHTSLQLPNEKMLIKNNCIDCHMPVLPSQKIALMVANSKDLVPDMIRTHRIGIYPEKTKAFLENLKTQK